MKTDRARTTRTLVIAGALALGAALIGCAQNGGSSSGGAGGASGGNAKMGPVANARTGDFVVNKDSPYYKNGPAQPMPPDGTFRADTRVTSIKSLGSYQLVRAADGRQGYVAKTSLTPAKK
ncbi:MAG TPA: hypothetical protein VER17_06075 [Tepidisphaeraceae bacterium]|nr:hypothetical protein [Tepidisphaeraceae bacterium]